MRGSDERSGALFSYVDVEDRVPAGHPLRSIRMIVNQALDALSGDFERLYGRIGRPGVPPEQLLRALLLQALYTIRSERQLMERLDFDLLFRWFVGLAIDDPVWDHSTFSKNRERLLGGDVAARFMTEVLNRPEVRRLLSDEHFSVDGTLVEAWASMKSFRPRGEGGDGGAGGGRNGEADVRGQQRRNDTHASTTDGDARLFRKGHGRESRLAYLGHLLTENRHGLVVRVATTRAVGRAEWEAGLAMVGDLAGRHRITVGGDKGYDVEGFAARAAHAWRHAAPRPTLLRHQDRPAPPLLDRRPHHASCGLRGQPAPAQTGRGSLRLDQDHRRSGEDQVQGARAGRLVVPARGRRLQPDPPAQAPGGRAMIPRADGRPPHASGASIDRPHGAETAHRAVAIAIEAPPVLPSSTAC
jgi:transposase